MLEVRWLGEVPYLRALEIQAGAVEAVRAERIPDQLILLSHPPVITLGSSFEPSHLLVTPEELARREIELHRVGRGGDVTYHGPGQLVAYPILRLPPERRDLHAYLRDLEEVVLRTLEPFGIVGDRERGLTGVWVGGSKIASIGVRVSSGWITSHGVALNVGTDLTDFETIVACGLPGRGMTSVELELGAAVEPEALRRTMAGAFGEVLGHAAIVWSERPLEVS